MEIVSNIKYLQSNKKQNKNLIPHNIAFSAICNHLPGMIDKHRKCVYHVRLLSLTPDHTCLMGLRAGADDCPVWWSLIWWCINLLQCPTARTRHPPPTYVVMYCGFSFWRRFSVVVLKQLFDGGHSRWCRAQTKINFILLPWWDPNPVLKY
mgnify:CR=1 FL=1